MKKTENLIKVFTGDEASVILLKSRLEENRISVLTKNDAPSSFLGVVPSIDLYITEGDLKKAKSLITEFTRKNKG
jgi:hypothetical protein